MDRSKNDVRAKQALIAVAVGCLAALAFASSAQADHIKFSECTIEGSATANVRWIGGLIDPYNFGPTGLGIDCVYTEAKIVEGVPSASAGLAEVNVGSSGEFRSTFCGTGTAADPDAEATSVTTTPDSPNAEGAILSANLAYNIVFDSFEGELTWENPFPPGGNNIPRPRRVPTSTGPVGGGPIDIWPWAPDEGGIFPGDFPDGFCTNGFNVEGTVEGLLRPGQ